MLIKIADLLSEKYNTLEIDLQDIYELMLELSFEDQDTAVLVESVTRATKDMLDYIKGYQRDLFSLDLDFESKLDYLKQVYNELATNVHIEELDSAFRLL